MKTILTLMLILCCGIASAQIFWTDDFGTGCTQGNLASAYTGTNGAWTITATGTNDANANQWFVSATEAGMGAGNCGDGCLTNASLSNRSLHLGATAIPGFVTADNGATYNSGGICALGYCVITNRRAESPTIDCSGKSGITISFNYLENGSATTDDATLWYFDGTAWSLLQNMAKTPTACAPAGQWTSYATSLPASADNNPNVKIGFNWTNNDDGVGSDPSFAVDDIQMSTVVAVCDVTMAVTDISCSEMCDGTAIATVTGSSPISFSWSNGATGDTLSSLCAGVYELTITDALGCTATTNGLVVEPLPLLVWDTIIANAACDTCHTGLVQVNINGGTAPYNILWSNGQTTTTISGLTPGVYASTVTDANGCVAVGSTEVMNLTGVETLNEITSLSVFPNPASSAFTILFNGATSTKATISIYDALGKLCLRQTVVNSNVAIIDSNQLTPGIYSVSVSTDNGSAVRQLCILP